jgi:hypothetical protein
MKKGILLVNLIMVLCIAALGYKLSADWNEWEQSHSQEALLERIKAEDPQIDIPLVDVPKSSASQNDQTLIGDHNLFHEDRNMLLPEAKAEAEPEKPVLKLRNRPVISGFLQMGDTLSAHVLTNTTEEGTSRSMLLSKGDKWEDPWVVESVMPDRLVLAAGDTREEVLYHDPSKKRADSRRNAANRQPQAGQQSSVVTIGSGAPASARAASPTPSARSPEKKRMMPNRAATSALKDRSTKEGIESGNRLFGSQRDRSSNSRSRSNLNSGQRRASPFSRSRSSSSRNSGKR